MLKNLPIAAFLFSGLGCDQSSVSKTTTEDSILKCMSKQHSSSDYDKITSCYPLSRQMHFQGTWFFGFEESVFLPGYSKTPARSNGQGIPLIYRKTLGRTMPVIHEGQRGAFQIAFVGRRTLDNRPAFRAIVVDRLISAEPVSRITAR